MTLPAAAFVRHYLDHASTTALRPSAVLAMREWIERLGGPDGAGDPARVHQEGREARQAIEIAREQVAELAGVAPSRIVFTSGATEAANTAVASIAPSVVLCARVEHSCVRAASTRSAAAAGGSVLEIAVDADGSIDTGHVSDLLSQLHPLRAAARPVLVHCQWANHEVGTVQPVDAVAALCEAAGAVLHVDAAAAFGHVPTDLAAARAQLASVTAHKMGGPAGVGALVLGSGVRLQPLLVGGSEERARRAGAENLIGIVGFGAASAELSASSGDGATNMLAAEAERARRHRDALAAAARTVAGVTELGPAGPDGRLPHISCLAVAGVLGEAVLLALDRAGIAAHSGSACSSEVLEPSPVLEAMGVDPDRSVRLSVGWSTNDEDVAAFADAWPEAVELLRSLGSREP